MRALIHLAWRSAWNRRFALGLVVATMALSAFLLLSVERVRHDVRTSFSQAVSGTDLIVGARGGALQLLLYSVFRLGQATHNISWASVQALKQDRAVAWVVPLSLGDTHRGYPVVATSAEYFKHFRYGDKQPLALREGQPFAQVFDVVLGAEVADRLGYRMGQPLVLSHGSGALESNDHTDKPFTVVGVLARTSTPVDRSLHISLEGMEAIHLDWMGGVPLPGIKIAAADVGQHDLSPKSVTAVLVGLKTRVAVFAVQRRVNTHRAEPLMAILPGVALDELWDAIGAGERALLVMSALVALVSLAGLVVVVVTALEQRRRELAILRSVGAGPLRILCLLALEGLLITLLGIALGLLLWASALALGGPWLESQHGIALRLSWLRPPEWALLGWVLAAGMVASLIPGLRAYHVSLADGLTPRD